MKKFIIASLLVASTCARAEDNFTLPEQKPREVAFALKVTGADLKPAPVVHRDRLDAATGRPRAGKRRSGETN